MLKLRFLAGWGCHDCYELSNPGHPLVGRTKRSAVPAASSRIDNTSPTIAGATSFCSLIRPTIPCQKKLLPRG